MGEIEREAAIWDLAKRLHWKMEHLAPTGENWEDTSQEERDYCHSCVLAILEEENLIREAYGWSTSDYGDVGGSAIKFRKQPNPHN